MADAAQYVHVIDHPLVKHHLARLRDVSTPPALFRELIHRLTELLTYEAAKDLPVEETAVRTPMQTAVGHRLTGRIGLVPILRAGLGMVDPVLAMLPDAEVWHLGFYRDEQTLRPVEYYKKLPDGDPVDLAMILDPMLATGGSAAAAVEALAEWGVGDIRVLGMLAAPEGITRVHGRWPHVRVFVCAIDERLNDHGFILPGLGDAGDRIFNTLPP
jgi:uracil phosphoribosyltransferase